ncbi:MAG: anti-sigma factor antagonist [Calditrichaeota bacterium]|nr:MAG: anti-sigma factor antagonist [Calditrichota bacterium]
MSKFKIIQISQQNDVAILTLQERRIYMNKSEQLREELTHFLHRGDKKIVVDLSKVNVMNSAGLGALIALQNEVDKRKGQLIIAGLQPLMQEIFDRMRLEQLFKIEKDVPAALRALQA